MNAVSEQAVVLIPGAAMAGGFFSGKIRVGDDIFALIVAPKADGDHDDTPWNKSLKTVEGALSYFDGRANTEAMEAAGSKIAKWARGLKIDGHDDWYIPSRDELELIYRNLKPGNQENYEHRNGDNPSSIPAGYPYTASSPMQSNVEAFQAGGSEAMEEAWYWSSTQSAPGPSCAWCQDFFGGYQDGTRKGATCRVRAVRRIKI